MSAEQRRGERRRPAGPRTIELSDGERRGADALAELLENIHGPEWSAADVDRAVRPFQTSARPTRTCGYCGGQYPPDQSCDCFDNGCQ